MSLALQRLAEEVGVSERTLRRGVGSGLLAVRRPDARRVIVSAEEAAWVRRHWPLVAELRRALRTEPNVTLAVLFGSVARGEDAPGASDVDLLVDLRRDSPGVLAALRLRLGEGLAADLQLVPLSAARRNPRLLSEILRDGRPLVDRAGEWSRLRAQASRVRAQADQSAGEARARARAALGYFLELAAARAQPL